MNLFSKTTFFFFFVLAIVPLHATIKLPAIIGSNMVIQRDASVALWGWAEPNEKIDIKLSWNDQIISIHADVEGVWKTTVKTTKSKAPQSIRLTGQDTTINLENILFGEVWLCAGQSNMEQPLRGFSGQPTYHYLETLARAKNPKLRLFTVNHVGATTPQKDFDSVKHWQEASTANSASFSAVAYFFGQQLQEILDVPVGLIQVTWGGTAVQSWMSKESLTPYQKIKLDTLQLNKENNSTRTIRQLPTVLFNGMINPVIPYTIKGTLWYQGESNRLEPSLYKQLFPAMVKDWRSRWNMGDFPFYYVQIAPYLYDRRNDYFNEVENAAFIREAQLECLDIIPNTGMTVTMDLGSSKTIHPPQKKEVADRLLYIALNKTYGLSEIDGTGPMYKSHEIKDGGILLHFNHVEPTGLYSYTNLEGFEIAGEDRVFYPANAIFKGVSRQVFVESKRVPNPVAVRYAWRNWMVGTLLDANLLPSSSFRTDRWNNASQAKE